MSANNNGNNNDGGNNNGNGGNGGGGSFIEVTLPPRSEDLPGQYDWDRLKAIPTPKP